MSTSGSVSIQATREKHGLSINRAARLIGVRPTTLRRAEEGKIPSRLDSMRLVAAFAGTRIERSADMAKVAEWTEPYEFQGEAVAA